MARQLKPQTPFAARLVEARGDMTRDALSVSLGIPKTTLGGYERGVSFPPPEILAKIRSVLGVSIDWLLTGEPPMRVGDAPGNAAQASRADFDEELLGRVVEGVSAVYREAGGRVGPRDLGRLAARIHTDLVAAYDDPAERLIGLRAALQHLRRELRTPPCSDASGKRSA
jgi:transcriptional regulator with XRE-family HTH domain